MAEIIQLDRTKREPKRVRTEKSAGCEHKHVIAYTIHRSVCCAVCGTLLDPFDVLLDMLKGYVPSGSSDRNEQRLDKEVERRLREKRKKTQPPQK